MIETIKHKVSVTEKEDHMLTELMALGTFMNKDEIFRMALHMLYKKALPAYKKKETMIPEGAITPEKQCEIDGGEVVMDGMIKKCVIKKGALREERII